MTFRTLKKLRDVSVKMHKIRVLTDKNQRWAAPTPERPLIGASSAPWSGAELSESSEQWSWSGAGASQSGAGAESERPFFV